MSIRKFLAPATLAVLFLALLIQLPIAIAARANDYQFFDPIIDIRHLLMERYVDEPNEQAMQESMIEGMLRVLNDPHTVYIPPELTDDFSKDLRGTYVGIGAEVTLEGDYLTIISPMDGSPALEAGVMAGDVILEINGESTYQKSITECIDTLLGEPGTSVSLRVRHLDNTEEILQVMRRQIHTTTVRGLRRLGEEWTYCVDDDRGLMYVRVTQFNQDSVEALRQVLEQLNDRGMRGLLLDLRDNPGGDLGAAVGMVDLFLDEGIIVSVRDRNGEGPTFRANKEGTLPQVPDDPPGERILRVRQRDRFGGAAGERPGEGAGHPIPRQGLGPGGPPAATEPRHAQADDRLLPPAQRAQPPPPPGQHGLGRRSGSGDAHPGLGRRLRREDPGSARVRDHPRSRGVRGAVRLGRLDSHQPEGRAARRGPGDHAGTRRRRRLAGRQGRRVERKQRQVALDQELERAVSRLNQLQERIAEMRALAEEAGYSPLLPKDADLLQGTITVRDKQGRVLGEYRIDGGDVELALETVELTPLGQELDDK